MVGWCDGAGSTSSAGASYNLDTVGQGATALAVGAGGGCLDIFTLIYPFSPLSPSLWETARYRLKYFLKGPLTPKQPTNQILSLRERICSPKEFSPLRILNLFLKEFAPLRIFCRFVFT